MIKRYNQPKRSLKKPLLVSLIAILAAIGVLAALELSGTTSFILDKKTAAPRTATQYTKGEAPAQTPASGQSGNIGSQPKDSDGTWSSDNKTPGNTESPSNTKLDKPTGNFVNNHRPRLSESDDRLKVMQSSCVTTPGASCQIIFTKGSTTKTLPAQKTDAGGGTYWNWKLQDVGLTEGAWKVQAKATLGTQTETAEDAAPLEVQP